MTKATIQSVRQTENAGLFTICFEGESFTEFQKFILKGHENATLQPDLQKIGPKSTKTYEEDPELNGYVIQLQKLDDLLRLAESKGEITIETATLSGVDDKQFDI